MSISLDATGNLTMSLLPPQGAPLRIASIVSKVERDPKKVHLRNHGVELLADDKGQSLILRFAYPLTSARTTTRRHVHQGDLTYRLRSSKQLGR